MDDLVLDPLVSRRLKPYISVHRVTTGNDSLDIYGGENLGVPNMWELVAGYLLITTDATVANRTPSIYKKIEGYNIEAIIRNAVTASSAGGLALSRNVSLGSASHLGSSYGNLNSFSFFFGDDDYLRVICPGGVVGDVFEFHLQFRWLNWDLGMMLPRIQKDSK